MRTRLAAPAVLALTVLTTLPLLAGPLNPPPGPITGTAKPLSEVEPRTAISTANTPGDADSVFRITQPGSYYLTGNITGASGKHGIQIAATGVTIDLMGFSLRGVSQSLSGIATEGARDAITIRDGMITGWGGSGIDLTTGGLSENALVERVSAIANGAAGIFVGDNTVIRACVAKGNATVGILAEANATISECAAIGNTTYGIEGVRAATITHCSARLNGLIGIAADYAAVITACSANGNGDDGISVFFSGTVSGCSAYENAANGIKATSGCTVLDCTAKDNTLDGINVSLSCLVRGNTCNSNGTPDTIGAGVHATGNNNRVEGNNCTNNDFGIDIDVPGNVIIKNTCADNTQNFVIVPNNIYGTIADRTAPASAPVAGNSATGTMGTTDPNANFAY